MPTAPTNHLPLFDDILRDYQRMFIEKVRASFRAGHKAVMGVKPTGLGKTTTAVALPKEGARVMVVVQQDVLVQQWVGTIRHLRRRAASIEQAWQKADAGDEWIVATIQTLQRNDRYKRFVGHVDLIIVDECDTHFSIKFREVMQEFIAAGARVLGLTATPYRGDKASLFGFYTDVPVCLELSWAFREGWLVKPTVFTHRVASMNFDALTKTRVDFKPEEIEQLLLNEAVLHDVANLVVQHHKKSHGLIRCRTVNQAKQVRELLVQRYGMKCSCVWGTQPEEERQEEIAKFVSGENTLIANCRVLGRGWDCPQINEIFNVAPTKSRAVFVQGLGRGLRTLPDTLKGCRTREERLAAIARSAKPNWVFHDLTNASRYHSVVTAIDILLVGSKEIVQKIKEKHQDEEVEVEQLEAELQEEIDRLKEMERLEREAEKARRMGMIVGVTFDSRQRDLFDRPDAKAPSVRCYRVPFGPWRGRPLRDPIVEIGWLKWALRKGKLNAMWTVAFQREIERREKVAVSEPEEVTPW
jgi:superfamily II DNA or RNA helicase